MWPGPAAEFFPHCKVDDSKAGLKLFGALNKMGFRDSLLALANTECACALGHPSQLTLIKSQTKVLEKIATREESGQKH